MRQNLPVSSVEFLLDEGKPIVAKTDLHGNIVYVNPYFVEVSGYSEQELLGAPHNIVRHPDMPSAAFADLWATLQSGLPWSGLLKNRRKNGDFYWVEASITPVLENGKAVGYVSVRTRPARAQVQAAAAAYRSIAAGNPGRLTIRQGQVQRSDWRGLWPAVKNLSTEGRAIVALATICAMLLGGGGAGALLLGGRQGAWFAAGGVFGAILIGALWHGLQASFVRPLRDAIRAVRTIASGELGGKLDTRRHDDVGQLLRATQQMNLNLAAIIGDVHTNVDSIRAATRDISTGNADLASRTASQAASLEESAASVERQTAENAQVASQLMAQAAAVALKGGEAVGRMGVTMNDISQAGRRIEEMISLIDGIAFQTNILALNAVVAAEVRQLAQRSTAAAKEIKAQLGDTVNKVAIGNQLVSEAGQTANEIVGAVEHVAGLMREIAVASSEQSAGIEQVNRAMEAMDERTRQNAALVEQSAIAATNLHDQAGRLTQAISLFTLARPAARAPASRPALLHLR